MASYTMTLTCDAAQFTNVLQYEVTCDRNGHSVREPEGRWAGCFCFEPGDTLHFKVVVHNALDYECQVNHLHLVCLPNFQPSGILSPFDENTSVVSVTKEGGKPTPGNSENPAIFDLPPQTVIDAYDITALNSWSMRGFLSMIIHMPHEGEVKPHARVLQFDPEVIVGGGSPPEAEEGY